ncbi:MAG: J domain-containing protein [Desulfobacterales bacterium]|nr:J domain-containing protein [Desulfobacterales bacterium]
MYLAEHIIEGINNYVIRDSQYDPGSDCWQSRDLYDLGSSPWDYIIYPGDNSFYIDERVTERLEALGVAYDLCELEELLWKFIRQEIRQKLEPFHCRGQRSRSQKSNRKKPEEQQVQVFDKRRIYYLRSGVVDQRRIGSVPLKTFSAVFNKSRDEIEQYFIQLEKSLEPREYKEYAYVIFDLQRHFAGMSARLVPQALDQDELDENFVKDLCSLHRDQLFWAGVQQKNRLHEYLVRYAVMFFDYEFDGGSGWAEYIQNFMNSKRFHAPPAPQESVAMGEIVEIFGVAEKELHAMNKSDLTKLFRQKAHELHPDKGGEHDAFVRLAEAYKEVLKGKI